jgi:O-antigen/teichoic acid export membrane protein
METSIDSQDQPQLPTATLSSRSLYRGILQGSSIYGLALVAPLAASVLLSPITTRCLSESEFGISELLTNVAIVLSALLSVNLSASMGYFYFAAPDAAGRRNAAGTAILGSALLGAIGALVCWPLAPYINHLIFPHVNATNYLRLIVVTLPLAFTTDALFTWLRIENRAGTFALGAVLRVLLTIAGILLLVWWLRLRIWGVLITATGAITVVLVYLSVLWLRQMKPTLKLPLFVAMARYALPLTGASLAMFFLHFGDKFFLPRALSRLPNLQAYEELAVYSIAYKFGMVLSMVFGAFGVYWNAQVFPIMRRADSADVFRRISTYMFLVISFIGLGLVVFSGPAVRIMYRPEYWRAAELVPLIVLAYFCRSIGDFFRCLFLVAGRPRYEAACTFIGAGICLVAYVTLIPRFGIWGAAIATAIAFVSIAVISLLWTYRVHRYSIDRPRLAKIAIALAAALALHWLAPASTRLTQIASGALSVLIFVGLLWISRFPTEGEWQFVRLAADRVRAKIAPAQ